MRNGASPELLLAKNDRTFNALWVLGVEEGSFTCECGGEGCGERLDLSLIEYAARDDGHDAQAGSPRLRRRGRASAG